jgi:hypothetical protein
MAACQRALFLFTSAAKYKPTGNTTSVLEIFSLLANSSLGLFALSLHTPKHASFAGDGGHRLQSPAQCFFLLLLPLPYQPGLLLRPRLVSAAEPNLPVVEEGGDTAPP